MIGTELDPRPRSKKKYLKKPNIVERATIEWGLHRGVVLMWIT